MAFRVAVAVLCVALCVTGATASAENQGLDGGFTTFFRSATCPDGWSELPEAQGRLLVSVADAGLNGLTLGNPLKDKEDRTHTHPFVASTSLPTKHVAAIGCCNDQAAANGAYTGEGTSQSGTSGLPFTQMVLCRLDATNSSYQVPFGTVAYYDSTVPACPASWLPYSTAAGRTLVPGYSAVSGTTKSLSTPLKSMEVRNHSHTFTTKASTDSVSFAGVDGCCNNAPAAAGTVSVSGTAEDAPSNLPYVQMLTCISMYETFNVSLPDNALLFNPLTGCPKGWQVAAELSGRMLVALPAGGEVGASFGGPSIGQGSYTEPGATHLVEGGIPTKSCGVGLGSGCCAGGYAKADDVEFTGTSSENPVQFPWMMITMCEQE